MSNYLYQLVAKNFNLINTVQPFLPSVFEPLPESDLLFEEADNSPPSTVTVEETESETASETEKFTFDIVQLTETTHKQPIEINRDVTHLQSPQVASSELSSPQFQPKPVTIAPTPNNMLSIVDNMLLTPVSVVETNTSASISVIQQPEKPVVELQSLQAMEMTQSVSSPQVQKLISLELPQYSYDNILPPKSSDPHAYGNPLKQSMSKDIAPLFKGGWGDLLGLTEPYWELFDHDTAEEVVVSTPVSNQVMPIVDNKPLILGLEVKTNTSASIPIIQQQQHPITELQSLQAMEKTRRVSFPQVQKPIDLELSDHHIPEETVVNTPDSTMVVLTTDKKSLTLAPVVETNTSTLIPVIQQREEPVVELQSSQALEKTQSVSSHQVQRMVSSQLPSSQIPEEPNSAIASASIKVVPTIDKKPFTPVETVETNTSASTPTIKQQQQPVVELPEQQAQVLTRSVSSSPQSQKLISKEISSIQPQPEPVAIEQSAGSSRAIAQSVAPSQAIASIIDRMSSNPRTQPLTPAIAIPTNVTLPRSVAEPQGKLESDVPGIQRMFAHQGVSSTQPPLTDVSPEPFSLETQSLTTLAVDDIPSSITSQQLTQLNAHSETITPTPALSPSTTVASIQPQVSFSSSHLSDFHEGIGLSPVDNLILPHNSTLNPSAYASKGNGVRSSYFRHLDESDIRPLSESINDGVTDVTEKSLSVITASSKEAQQRSLENLETPSVVQVTIGRLEIRATPPPAPPQSRKPRPTRSVMSLDEYLRRRAQRR